MLIQQSITLVPQSTTELDKKLEDASRNGKQYARKDGAWSEVVIPDPDLSNYVQEAPKNGKEYGRKNGDWVALDFYNFCRQPSLLRLIVEPSTLLTETYSQLDCNGNENYTNSSVRSTTRWS